VFCTVDSCDEATDTIVHIANDGLCDNGQFCDGAETCDPINDCQAGTPVNVDDGVSCTDDSCNEATDTIVNTPNDGLCDNGQFCDGAETCDPNLDCQAGMDPCAPGDTCDEGTDTCVPPAECTTDADCDDGLFCNGTEKCTVNGECQPGNDPCFGSDICDEDQDTCIAPTSDLDIVRFRVDKSAKLGKSIRRLQVTVRNTNGGGTATAEANLIGVQDGKQVYNETRTVWDLSGDGAARWAFPSYTPIKKGTIDWTVTLTDGDPDDDTATGTTNVKDGGSSGGGGEDPPSPPDPTCEDDYDPNCDD
jgi:hypothetical protein